MTPAELLLKRLRANGFWLEPDLERGSIVIRPASELDDDLRELIRTHKAELLELLSALPADLEARICAMAERWQYSAEDLADVLYRARRDPVAWRRVVEADEELQAKGAPG
jgi:hypothetical protein